MGPVDNSVREVIKESAQVCRDAAQQTMKIMLDYNEVSINQIDEIISIAWPNGPSGNSDRDTYRYQIWGCFLGEAICQTLGAEWVKTDLGYGVRVGHAVAHPIAKIEKRFLNGMDESISSFYKVFKESIIPKYGV